MESYTNIKKFISKKAKDIERRVSILDRQTLQIDKIEKEFTDGLK